MIRSIKFVLVCCILLMFTPFGLVLEHLPGFHGWGEWFRFCRDTLKDIQ